MLNFFSDFIFCYFCLYEKQFLCVIWNEPHATVWRIIKWDITHVLKMKLKTEQHTQQKRDPQAGNFIFILIFNSINQTGNFFLVMYCWIILTFFLQWEIKSHMKTFSHSPHLILLLLFLYLLYVLGSVANAQMWNVWLIFFCCCTL